MFPFSVVPGTDVGRVLAEHRPDVVKVVRDAYLTHHRGDSVNPRSYFLRFPDNPSARIIALPASLGGDFGAVGIKWIGSFPGNIDHNIPRASAVLILNDPMTGFPFACLEASGISAARTAGSAVLAAEALLGARKATRVAFVGAGVIARTVLDYLGATGWQVGDVAVADLDPRYGQQLAAHAAGVLGSPAGCAGSPRDAVTGADLIVLATTAGEPHLTDPGLFTPGQVVLNLSLRDLSPQILLAAHNVLDDVDHCLTAATSPHLAEQLSGARDFIDGTLAGFLLGEFALGRDRPVIFSPFGLGVLDLAVGSFVVDQLTAAGRLTSVEGFFAETERWTA
jgi:ornithine cyclodeaminase